MAGPGKINGLGLIKGLGAVATLIVAMLGVPAFLVIFVGNPLPASFQWSLIVSALTRPDDGTILVSLIAILAWLAWAVFTASVVVELLASPHPHAWTGRAAATRVGARFDYCIVGCGHAAGESCRSWPFRACSRRPGDRPAADRSHPAGDGRRSHPDDPRGGPP